MRMWMINPAKMCDQHLLGEHVEHHMIVGSIERKKSVAGFIRNNCMQPLALRDRHDAIAAEMTARGMRHRSPLKQYDISYLPADQQSHEVDVLASEADLFGRCKKCRERMKALLN